MTDARGHDHVDVLLVGGGIVSATLASLLLRAEPSWAIEIVERLDGPAAEASNAWHNAGTGHAALCELNYTVENPDGSIDISKAISVHEQFLTTELYWSALVKEDALGDPRGFINSTPHLTFVTGEDDSRFLANRYRTMREHHFFREIEHSTSPELINQWAPLLVENRELKEPLATTFAAEGTDIDFGSVTRQLIKDAQHRGANLRLNTEVIALSQRHDGRWQARVLDRKTGEVEIITARKVLVGAGGWTLKLLRSARVPEARGYGLFPVAGTFVKSAVPDVIERHRVKVYGRGPIGAPPMSMPHLDARIIDGEQSVLFGPFAGAIPKFLRNGSSWDLVQSLKLDNLWPLITMGRANLPLTALLLRDVLATHSGRIAALQEFAPSARASEWTKLVAGQRAQIVKPDATGRGALQFGTEVISSSDGTIAGVLGASPGASTTVSIALDVLQQCFPERFPDWQRVTLRDYIPNIGVSLAADAKSTRKVKRNIAETLRLN